MKPGSVGPPKIYLGGHMRKITLANGSKAWVFILSQYVQAAVQNVEEYHTGPHADRKSGPVY